MTKISSSMTGFYKRIFPVLWFGFLAVFTVLVVFAGDREEDPSALAFTLLVVAFMAVIGFVVLKTLVWDLIDEVYDEGDVLLVRNRGEEDRIAISDVMNVSATTFVNPPRITLRLTNPSRFGDEVTFSPITGVRLNPFAKYEVAEDLIARVHQARSRGHAPSG